MVGFKRCYKLASFECFMGEMAVLLEENHKVMLLLACKWEHRDARSPDMFSNRLTILKLFSGLMR